jgi:MerR family transcriptional regulator, copper efflux regulator
MKIGQLAGATGLTTKAIRYYESIGLLPEPERQANGYRSYDREAVERLRFVGDARATGLSLAEVGLILDMKDHGKSTCDHVVFMLEERIDSIDRQVEELRRARTRLGELIERARTLDVSTCRDPNRCQTIQPAHTGDRPA